MTLGALCRVLCAMLMLQVVHGMVRPLLAVRTAQRTDASVVSAVNTLLHDEERLGEMPGEHHDSLRRRLQQAYETTQDVQPTESLTEMLDAQSKQVRKRNQEHVAFFNEHANGNGYHHGLF